METELEIISEKPESSPQHTPLLFVHGMCHGAWSWKENFLPYFAGNNYASYAVNLRAHGKSKSAKKLRSIKIADYVSDVASAVSQIEAPPVLIGHSMGGMIVQKYLESNQAPAAVLLASVPPQGVFSATIRFALRRPLAFIRINATLSLYPMVETPDHFRKLLFSGGMPEELAEKYHPLMQDDSIRAYLDMLYFDLPNPELVKTPVIVLGGAEDAIITRKEYEKTARAYGVKAEIFPNIGHDMMLDVGWQSVADRMLELLKEKGI